MTAYPTIPEPNVRRIADSKQIELARALHME